MRPGGPVHPEGPAAHPSRAAPGGALRCPTH
jgi:hypothetical protein